MTIWKKLKLKFVAFAVTSGFSLALAIILFSIFSIVVHSDRIEYGKRLNTATENILTESVEVLLDLNALDLNTCTPENLFQMRKAQFLSLYIQDIAFFEENVGITCLTGLGNLEEPIPEYAPEFISKGEFWFWSSMPLSIFDLGVSAPIIRKDRYNTVLDFRSLSDITLQPFEWQIVYNHAEIMGHIAGQPGLHVLSSSENSLTESYHVECTDDELQICSTIYINYRNILEHYSTLLNSLAIIWILLGYIAHIFIEKRINIYHSLKYRISKGFKHNNFYPLFQPIVDLKTGEVVGCEMLARFKDANGSVYPDMFIPIIQELGLTWPFTEMLLAKALDELEKIETFQQGFRFSFNVFPSDIITNDIQTLTNNQRLLESRFKLILEITENEFLEEQSAQRNLTHISKVGIAVAIDDFGTGYSNLMQLKKISSEILKIDRSWLFDLEEGAIKASMISHIVNIAHTSKLEIVAEGVENEQQREILENMNIEYGQGWVFGKPMLAKDLALVYERSYERTST
mgnify:CR=1 FL=1